MSRVDVAVVGASGAVGEQVLAALATSRMPIGRVVAFVSRASKAEEVSFGERSLSVTTLHEMLEEQFGLAFLCVPASVSERVAPNMAGRGTLLIDIGGSSGMDLPLWMPGVTPELAEVATSGGLRTPGAGGWLLCSLLMPLRELGVTGVSGWLSLSASASGRAGIEELGAQVVASFNSREPPKRIFPEGLAFDVLPEFVAEDEWSPGEQQISAEVEALVGIPAEKIAVTLGTTSLFSGIVGGLHIRGVTMDAVEEALREAPGLRAVSRAERLRPRALVEKNRTTVSWGRLRADPSGDGVHLWVVGDNLTGAAGAVPIAAAEWMLNQGLLSRGVA